ncbi:BTAD domain-containing putative transcriptional regulator [Gordonia sp. SL306]|uniref:BTAD domain-containing putative transcriptional regulator n=1 Tax=Gordonia sp. SL306 TaxID=2995145 RepID=UPI00226DE4C1|nr:BTAD domain-containing putative transcriptional regulator [Gordonia sp. SL306]WAC55684.1 BTAD domain-containing putative transcriptional regulator [Gordonia sp. SL306]
MARLTYSVLGGLGAQIDSETVELGTRKQRAVLAQLILADGDPVSTDRLIDGIWGSAAPDRAEVSVQAYISGLRKALEPARKPRTPSMVLITRGPGYALVADTDDVDIRQLVGRIAHAHDLHRRAESATAAEVLQTALAQYRPLLPEFEGLPFRDDAAAHLDRTIAEAQKFSYDVRLSLGENRSLVTELEQAVLRSPLDEGLWVLLATAHYRLGRQSDALAALADARRILADEVGVDPGPLLRALERDILDHAPSLNPPATVPLSATPPAPDHSAAPRAREHNGVQAQRRDTALPESLIGRVDELAVLHRAVLGSLHGPGGIVVVEGEPGAGKTALLDAAAGRAAAAAVLTVLWGRCIEDAAAPSMWPWVQVLGAVLPELDDAQRGELLDSDLGRMVTQGATVIPPPREMPDATARFRFYDQAADLLEGVARSHLLIIVLDDLQWADSASLELFAHMAARRAPGVTFFASVRSVPRRAAVTNALATLARLPEHRRIEVGPLSDDDISEMVRRETREWPAAGTVASIAARTGGNAFFVRELSRILADRGTIGDGAVPAGVRDVVRERLRSLPASTTDLLDVAAVIGRRVDITLLAAAADRTVDMTLEALDLAVVAGVVDVDPADPFVVTFDHDLIRETIVDDIPTTRAYRLHLSVADELETGGQAARLAGHLWAAGPLADRVRTARALLAAARIALRSFSFDTAEQQLGDAAGLARAAGEHDLELDAITTLLAADVARNGYFAADAELLRRARELGEASGNAALLTHLDYARFAAHSQLADTRKARRVADELHRRARQSDDQVVRHLGMQAAGIDLFDRGNIGDAFRILEAYAPIDTRVDGLQSDQMMIARGFRALSTTLHVDARAGRIVFEEIETVPDEPTTYLGTAIFAVTAAALAGDVDWARDAGERLLSAPTHSALEYLRHGGERLYWWSRALGDDPADALDRIERLAPTARGERTGLGLWFALHAEALVAAGTLNRVPALLEQAENFARTTGERYPDAHRLLVCAEYQHAADHPAGTVQDMLCEARRVATAQEATALVTRIDAFAADHGYTSSPR